MAKKSDRKYKAKAYLIGAMENVPDGGKGWRRLWTIDLNKLNIEVVDPTDLNGRTPAGDKMFGGKTALRIAKEKGDQKEIVRLMDGVWKRNAYNVDNSDIVIFYEPHKRIRSIGSVREKQRAFDKSKVVLTVYPHDWRNLSVHTLHLLLKKGKIFTCRRDLMKFLAVQTNLKKIQV